MYCCAQGTHHYCCNNIVQFLKLKVKYMIDKDIIVDYMVQNKIVTSSRDWIGIFPRGWVNLEQYLTFEYVIVSPKTSIMTYRRLVFLHYFHRKASPHIDYQFVYVGKEIEILGTSSYFRFVIPPRLSSLDRNASTPDCGAVHVDDSPSNVLPVTSNEENLDACNRIDRSDRVDHPSSKEKSFARNRIQFLLLHNEQLVSRMSRLARDLELTASTVEMEKMQQAALKKKLETYEVFVSNIFKYLNIMGTIKIVDKDATEIIVQKVKSNKPFAIYNDQGYKTVPIFTHPATENSTKYKKDVNEGAVKNCATTPVPQEPNLFESNENIKAAAECAKEDETFSVKEESASNRDEKNSQTVQTEEQCQYQKSVSVDTAEIPYYSKDLPYRVNTVKFNSNDDECMEENEKDLNPLNPVERAECNQGRIGNTLNKDKKLDNANSKDRTVSDKNKWKTCDKMRQGKKKIERRACFELLHPPLFD